MKPTSTLDLPGLSIPAMGCGAAPHRVRLSRKKGFRLPENTVVVSRPSNWGNPFLVVPGRTQAQAVFAFDTWLTTEVSAGIKARKRWMLDHLSELRGKNLACWCALDKPCHADVLLRLANLSAPESLAGHCIAAVAPQPEPTRLESAPLQAPPVAGRRLTCGEEVAAARSRVPVKRRLRALGITIPAAIQFDLAALERLEREHHNQGLDGK